MRLSKGEWAAIIVMVPIIVALLVRGHWLKEHATAVWQKGSGTLSEPGYTGGLRKEVECSLSRQRDKNGTYFMVSVNNNSAYPLRDVVVAVDAHSEGQKAQRQRMKLPAIKYSGTVSARVPGFKNLAEEIEPVCALVAYKTFEVYAPPPSAAESPQNARVFAPTRLEPRPTAPPPATAEVKVPAKVQVAETLPAASRAAAPAPPAAPDCSGLAPNSLSRRECEQQVADAAQPVPGRAVRIGGPVMSDATSCSTSRPNVPVTQCLNQLAAERQRTETQREAEAWAATARAGSSSPRSTPSSSSETPTRGPSGCRSARQVMIAPGQMSCAD